MKMFVTCVKNEKKKDQISKESEVQINLKNIIDQQNKKMYIFSG